MLNTAAVVLSLVIGHDTGVIWPSYVVVCLGAVVVKVVSTYRLIMILRCRPAAPSV
ncbi:hypothetical protein [Actinomadura alba]|uniref:Uncharacterized protein n=1 Tax=Actinomadura alba TaxID=406431 RepID=A0ABR7LWI1_9ACTN|nr:hypothetical protein [Actinomadura alba]MBC6469106.1 hypothetical protein [Actinomadura alba]